MILQVVVLFFIPSPTQRSGVICEVSPQTVSATWETKDLHLPCSSKLRRKHPRVSVIVHTVRYEALASLLKIKDTGVHQQMDMFMWFCAATMFKWDISLMLSLQLSRLVPRFYQTNDHSLKQTDSRASAWLGPPGGGGECILWCLSGRALAHSSDWGVRMLPEAMQGSSVLLLLLSYVSLAALKYFYLWKILLIYFCLIFPVDCQLVVEAESVIISV